MAAFYTDLNGKYYRTDCSGKRFKGIPIHIDITYLSTGYVSMSWNLSTSLSTETLPTVSHPIDKNELNTGDILLKKNPSVDSYGHTLIFDKWANNERTYYWVYEQHGPTGTPTVYRQIPYPHFNETAYDPYRYREVE